MSITAPADQQTKVFRASPQALRAEVMRANQRATDLEVRVAALTEQLDAHERLLKRLVNGRDEDDG